MVFGRKKRKQAEQEAVDENAEVADDLEETDLEVDPHPEGGPYDYDDVADRLADVLEQRLDLGSVVLPMPEGTQLQVEMSATGAPQAVHLTLPHGRITVAAYAAPKSPGQWREVTADLAESLRKDNAKVSVEMGPWGREVVASTPNADLRFIGVDGYRWMVRLVAAGPAGATVADGPLIKAARAVLSDTVVRRGTDPHPVRTPLPVVLPAALAQQLAAAHQQQAAAAQAAAQQAQQQPQQSQSPQPQQQPQPSQTQQQPQPQQPQLPWPQQESQPQQEPQRGAQGSAMQQLGRQSG